MSELIVNAHDGGETYTSLITQQVHAFGILLQLAEVLLGTSQFSLRNEQIGRNRRTGILILLNACINLVQFVAHSS